MQIKENKKLNIQQKQNYPDSVASYDTQPENEASLFYNGRKHHTGPFIYLLLTYTLSVISQVGNLLHPLEMS